MNEVNLTGRLGKDPQFWGGESPRATFSIAVETRTEDPEWIPITVFGTQAEVIVKHLGKGRKVAVTGRLHAYRSDEQSSTFISVIARHVEFLDFPKERFGQVADVHEEGFEDIAEFPEEVDAS